MRRGLAPGRLALLAGLALLACPGAAQGPPPPLVYDLRLPAAAAHEVEVEVTVPTAGKAEVELYMAVWSPGYYKREDYATRLRHLAAWNGVGERLPLEVVAPNRWRVETGGAHEIALRYRLLAAERSVTLNWVDEELGVLNGAAAFVTLVEPGPRTHEVRLHLPPGWTGAASALETVSGETGAEGPIAHLRAADFDTLVDSPILAGRLEVRELEVAGSRHLMVDAGELEGWDAERAVRDLERMVAATRELWGLLPFDRYLFLHVHRPGGGGLEHRNSTLVTLVPERVSTPEGYAAWLSLVAHEYAHAFNVERLRPLELGPFDYEAPPTTENLWISEGLTTYVSELVLCRAGLLRAEQYLASLSRRIERLQATPGRRFQTLEESSRAVWATSRSGLAENPETTVSYYVKGPVVGFLLDVLIQRATAGRRSLDDLMRLAYSRHSGERGFTAAEFRQAAEEIAGRDLGEFFEHSLASTEELDYEPVLAWYGLRFTSPPAKEGEPQAGPWRLEPDPAASPEQVARRERCGG